MKLGALLDDRDQENPEHGIESREQNPRSMVHIQGDNLNDWKADAKRRAEELNVAHPLSSPNNCSKRESKCVSEGVSEGVSECVCVDQPYYIHTHTHILCLHHTVKVCCTYREA